MYCLYTNATALKYAHYGREVDGEGGAKMVSQEALERVLEVPELDYMAHVRGGLLRLGSGGR